MVNEVEVYTKLRHETKEAVSYTEISVYTQGTMASRSDIVRRLYAMLWGTIGEQLTNGREMYVRFDEIESEDVPNRPLRRFTLRATIAPLHAEKEYHSGY